MKKAIMIIVAMVAGIILLTGCATTGRVEEIEKKLEKYVKGVDGYTQGQGIEAIEINIKIKLQPSSQDRSELRDSVSTIKIKPD